MVKTVATIKRPTPVIVPEAEVTLRIPETTASLLFGLLSHIRRWDGFDPIHKALKELDIPKTAVHLDFVGEGILRVEQQ